MNVRHLYKQVSTKSVWHYRFPYTKYLDGAHYFQHLFYEIDLSPDIQGTVKFTFHMYISWITNLRDSNSNLTFTYSRQRYSYPWNTLYFNRLRHVLNIKYFTCGTYLGIELVKTKFVYVYYIASSDLYCLFRVSRQHYGDPNNCSLSSIITAIKQITSWNYHS